MNNIFIFFFGILGVLGFSPFNYCTIFLISLNALFIAIWNTISIKDSIKKTFIWALGLHSASLFWIFNSFLIVGLHYFIPLAYCSFIALLSIYYIIISFSFYIKNNHKYYFRYYLLFIVLYSITEYLKGLLFTGFPWNLTAYIFAKNILIANIASYIGSYSLGLLTVAVFCIPGLLYIKTRKYYAFLSCIIIFIILNIEEFFVDLIIPQNISNNDYYSKINLSLIQPNIPQIEKNNMEFANTHFKKLLYMSNIKNTTYIIWPECAIPWLIRQDNDFAKRYSIPIISGVTTMDKKNDIYNSIIVWDHINLREIYSKQHLVPFGEYFPCRNYINNAIGNDIFNKITPGKIDYCSGIMNNDIKLIGLPKFRALICYESIFPGTIDYNTEAKWILILTNDAWFGNSIGPYQHLSSVVFRAIEYGMPIVRCANTGISCLIDPYGRILSKTQLNEQSVLNVHLIKPRNKTVYFKYKDKIFCIMLIIMLLLICLLK